MEIRLALIDNIQAGFWMFCNEALKLLERNDGE